MSENDPSHEVDDGRRDLLKGLGFGTVGAMLGAGAAPAAAKSAQPGSFTINRMYTALPGERSPTTTFTGGRTTEGNVVLVLDDLPPVGSIPLGYQMTILQDGQVVNATFEEGSSMAFGGMTDAPSSVGGELVLRESFSLAPLTPPSGSSPAQYTVALTITSYAQAQCEMATTQIQVTPPGGGPAGGQQGNQTGTPIATPIETATPTEEG